MLSDEQNAALEKAGTALVSILLANMPNAGSDASVAGLQCAKPPPKAEVENWLASRIAQDRKQQTWTLWWAAIAGVGAIIGAVLAGVTLWR